MKRIAAATLAAATAVSLTALPAQAEENDLQSFRDQLKPESASEVSDAYLAGYKAEAKIREELRPGTGYSQSYKRSSEKNQVPNSATSSLKNDAARGYKLGTTYDILVGPGIAAAVLAVLGLGAAAAGMIPGVELPQLPF